MTTNEKLRLIRLYLGLTQKEFADLIGVSRCTVAFWESNRSVPSPITLSHVATKLGYSADDLKPDDKKTFRTGYSPIRTYNVRIKCDTEISVYASNKNEALSHALSAFVSDYDEYLTTSVKAEHR